MSGYGGPLQKIDDYSWVIPGSYKTCMRTDAIVYANEKLVKSIRKDAACEQAAKDVEDKVQDIVAGLYNNIPTGLGTEGKFKADGAELKRVLKKGAKRIVELGYGHPEDITRCEESGCMEGADPELVSKEAIKRGLVQIATLGSGNHFVEMQAVEEIYDDEAARTFGIDVVGQIVFMIHTGSRGFGHQVCQDSLSKMQRAVTKYSIDIPDRQLACAPVKSEEGQTYLAQMACAANFAWANRQAIAHWVRETLEKVIRVGAHKLGLSQVYDVAHNIAKIEWHTVDGRDRKLCVHRKGATRAFGPGSKLVPEEYRETGQPVIVPGDMGRYSYLLAGTEEAMQKTWGSTCHGAGRVMSRNEAIKKKSAASVISELEEAGIAVMARGRDTLQEEASYAYKDVEDVVESCVGAKLSTKIARMRPLGVIKG